MNFLRNAWYVAAWSEELTPGPLARTVIKHPLVLFRRTDGAVGGLADACPHRFAPLSRGHVAADIIECGYHGLRFNTQGECVFNPHGKITSNLKVRSYPIIERHGIVWVWMGEPAAAASEQIPDLSFMAPSTIRKTVHNYIGPMPCRYDVLVDNLLDLSHEDYLHRKTFSGGPGGKARLAVQELGNMVLVERLTRNMPKRPRYEFLGELVDVKYTIRWWPSQALAFERTYSPAGRPEGPSATARFCHIATPQNETSTHYFHAVTRTDNIDDQDIDERTKEIAAAVIVGEDGPMLEAISFRMGGADLMDLRPVSLPTDVGALRVRAVMRRLLQTEKAT